MAKILISAQIYLDPATRDEALRTAQPWIDGALAQPGCVHYDWSADLTDLARVNVFEEWASEASLAAHFVGPQYAGMRDLLGNVGISNAISHKYRVDAEGPVYGADGEATEKFD